MPVWLSPVIVFVPKSVFGDLLSGWLGAWVGFGFLSAVGALVYCFLLDLIVRPVDFTFRTYFWVCTLCVIAAIPLVAAGAFGEWSISVHKASWWMLFAAGLALAANAERTRSAARRPP
ncbi:MAG TPA: hypothetical protein PKZ76_03025 [Xanthomonadaceae bacterium]|nr:hypothetical protein [Xanthomonadaceae bacterium]